MKIQIEAPFQVHADLEELVQEKVGKLGTYFERILSATVFFKEEEHRHSNEVPAGKTAEIRLDVPGQTLYADSSADSFEKALAETTQKVGRQLRKYKQQLSR